jgi:hypothetical protein
MKNPLGFDRARRRLPSAGAGSLATTVLGPLLVTEKTVAQKGRSVDDRRSPG